MSDLTEFLLARIAEDGAAWEQFEDDGTVGTWSHWGRLDFEAKRRIVEEHGEGRPWSPAQNPGRCRVCTAISDSGGTARFRAPCPTLRLLALPYADHPDYREEWRP